jgi:hypothetical protein
VSSATTESWDLGFPVCIATRETSCVSLRLRTAETTGSYTDPKKRKPHHTHARYPYRCIEGNHGPSARRIRQLLKLFRYFNSERNIGAQ